MLIFLLLSVFLLSNALAKEDRGFHASGNYAYDLLDDGTAEIVMYKGKDIDLLIPDHFDGIPVTSIGKSAFSFCDSLITVTIPEGVVEIKKYAFEE